MTVLHLIFLLKIALFCRYIVFAVVLGDELFGARSRLFRNTQRVRSHIGNHTEGTETGHIHTFIQLLRHFHRALGLETEFARGFLLHGRGDEGRLRRLFAHALCNGLHLIFCAFQFCQNGIGFFFIGQFYLFAVFAVKSGFKLFFGGGRHQFCRNRPILLRHKGTDFFFPVYNEPERNRLHPARAQPSADFLRYKRRKPVTDQAV